jgi:hypothetical protein
MTCEHYNERILIAPLSDQEYIEVAGILAEQGQNLRLLSDTVL